MNTHNLNISVDWLQLYCDVSNIEYSDEFEVKKLDYGTKHFIILEEIYLQGSLFATMLRQPRSDIIKAHTGILKISNSLLYSQHAFNAITNFVNLCGIHILSITRIDIAIDFVKFHNGLTPSNLIKGFMRSKYLKNGRGKYTIIGEQKNVMDVSYLRFGTKASEVNAYLYNKSKEMRETVWKNYIAESWNTLENKNNSDVWRLEFSLKSKATTFLNKENGEIEQINLSILDDNNQKTELLKALIQRYFEFKINDNQKNKTRMKALLLFKFNKTGFSNIYLPKAVDIYKKDKTLLKNLYILNKEFRGVDKIVVESTRNVISYMRTHSYLNNYFESKKDSWDKTTYRV